MNEYYCQQIAEAKSLLLVDDDPTFCEVLGAALDKRGFSVRIAHAVHKALALAGQALPAYAVIDLVMPEGSGLDGEHKNGGAVPAEISRSTGLDRRTVRKYTAS
jgi:ActR/RegA family two-component response regulator